MIGHKFGEFAITKALGARVFTKKKKKKKKK
jgi:ribosomal protein S19